MEFNEFYWHDSEIVNIEIDRSKPGEKDTVVFKINWYDKGLSNLVFENVYSLRMNMNFGIIAAECIDIAYIADSSDNTLDEVYKKWGGLIDEIQLYCYVIKTISTGSEIKIIAMNFRVDEL